MPLNSMAVSFADRWFEMYHILAPGVICKAMWSTFLEISQWTSFVVNSHSVQHLNLKTPGVTLVTAFRFQYW